MKKFNDIQEILEDHKGRKLDFSNRRDLALLKMAIDREFEKLNGIISNVQNVLNGQRTYDQTQYKTILDSSRIK